MLDPLYKNEEGLPLTCRAVFIIGACLHSPFARYRLAAYYTVANLAQGSKCVQMGRSD